DQRKTPNAQRPTTNEKRPTTNGKRSTPNELHRRHRPPPWLAVETQGAAVQEDDLLRQREAHAEAGRFVRMEGEEEALRLGGIEADAVVGDGEGGRCGGEGGAHGAVALLAHGVDGVAEEG